MDAVLARLKEMADEQYRAFNQSLLPGVTGMLGVRMGDLRALAKAICREDWRAFLAFDAQGDGYEQIMLRGIVIGYARMEADERYALLGAFVPLIANWAVCDSCCTTYAFMREDRERAWAFLAPYLEDEREFAARFAVVCLIDHFLTPEWAPAALDAALRVEPGRYYVDMARAWLVAVCFARFSDMARPALEGGALDGVTRRMAVRKILDSHRTTREQRAFVRGIKEG